MGANTTFLRITNKDIYQKLCDIEKQTQITNGKVKLNRWISTTSLMGVFSIAGWMFYILSQI